MINRLAVLARESKYESATTSLWNTILTITFPLSDLFVVDPEYRIEKLDGGTTVPDFVVYRLEDVVLPYVIIVECKRSMSLGASNAWDLARGQLREYMRNTGYKVGVLAAGPMCEVCEILNGKIEPGPCSDLTRPGYLREVLRALGSIRESVQIQ